MNIHNLVIRYASHLGQKYPRNIIDNIHKFFHEVISKRSELLIDVNNFDLLVNCYETSVFFESTEKKNVCLKGTKDITINTFGNDKLRISLLLAICGSGKNFPLY